MLLMPWARTRTRGYKIEKKSWTVRSGLTEKLLSSTFVYIPTRTRARGRTRASTRNEGGGPIAVSRTVTVANRLRSTGTALRTNAVHHCVGVGGGVAWVCEWVELGGP